MFVFLYKQLVLKDLSEYLTQYKPCGYFPFHYKRVSICPSSKNVFVMHFKDSFLV